MKSGLPLTLLLFVIALPIRADFRAFERLPVDPAIEQELARIAGSALEQFGAAGLKEGNLSITLIDLSGESPRRGSYAGRTPYHPASVVKAFYLTSAWDQIEKRKLAYDEALKKALRDMIVDSSNDATAYVVDRITGTTGGPELTGRAFRRFVDRRNLMNRYFRAMGYDISANGKTWCEAPYGRERQILGANRENRNRANSDAFAALMLWIVRRQAVSPRASEEMLALMSRPLATEAGPSADSQVTEFVGEGLPAGAKLWSKAGWTSEVRHDMAYVELPGGRRYVIAVMTRGASEEKTVVPWISRRVAEWLSRP